MVGSKCAFNPATALRRVFMPSTLGTADCLHVTRIFVPALLSPSTQQVRTYLERPGFKAGTWGSTKPSKASFRLRDATAAERAEAAPPPKSRRFANEDRPGPRVKTKLGRLPRDDEIRQPYVKLSTILDDGEEGLTGPQSVKDLLATLDRKTESLQITYMPDLEEKPQRGQSRLPIAKIINKKLELQKAKQEKEERKKQVAANREKEMEINWALTSHDLDYKLKKIKGYLANGWKVQVLLMRKQNAKARATEKDAQALVDRILEAVAEVKGSKEWKGRMGQLLGTMKLFLQGKKQENVAAAAEESGPSDS